MIGSWYWTTPQRDSVGQASRDSPPLIVLASGSADIVRASRSETAWRFLGHRECADRSVVGFIALSHRIGCIRYAGEIVFAAGPLQHAPESEGVAVAGAGSKRRDGHGDFVWESRVVIRRSERSRRIDASSASAHMANLMAVQRELAWACRAGA